MASTFVIGFPVILLVLQPWIALSHLLPPLFSPVSDDVCKEVVCGKGTCKPSNQSALFLFECECDPGWKQANFGLAQNFKFLPCVVPDCAIGTDCSTLGISSSNKSTSATPAFSDDDELCKDVVCGKGTCKPSNQSAFFLFDCECNPGWKQASFGLAEKFQFRPCVVPDCTINYSCMNASSPVRDKGSIANESIFDPCHWTDCGGGFCNKTSNFTYSCECAKDYYGILNDTSLPCFQECAIGTDCSTLGISSSNKSTSATQVVSDDGMNHAASILQGHYFWLTALMTFMAMVRWK